MRRGAIHRFHHDSPGDSPHLSHCHIDDYVENGESVNRFPIKKSYTKTRQTMCRKYFCVFDSPFHQNRISNCAAMDCIGESSGERW